MLSLIKDELETLGAFSVDARQKGRMMMQTDPYIDSVLVIIREKGRENHVVEFPHEFLLSKNTNIVGFTQRNEHNLS